MIVTCKHCGAESSLPTPTKWDSVKGIFESGVFACHKCNQLIFTDTEPKPEPYYTKPYPDPPKPPLRDSKGNYYDKMSGAYLPDNYDDGPHKQPERRLIPKDLRDLRASLSDDNPNKGLDGVDSGLDGPHKDLGGTWVWVWSQSQRRNVKREPPEPIVPERDWALYCLSAGLTFIIFWTLALNIPYIGVILVLLIPFIFFSLVAFLDWLFSKLHEIFYD
jgi:hypothetical protein